MKRLIMLCLAVLSLNPIMAEEVSNDNYLPNPGFEEGLKYWAPWIKQNGTLTADETTFHSGKKSLRIEWKELDRRMETYIFPYQGFGDIFTPGKTYTVSGWIKIGNVPPGKKGPTASLQDGSSQGGSPNVQGPTDPATNGGWAFVSFQFKSSEEKHGLSLRCFCDVPADSVPGTIWFDDLKVEEGDKPTAFRPDWLDASEFYTREPHIYWFPVPVDYRASPDVVTPHVELCKPSAAGPLRMLWAGFFYNARVACELAERADLIMDSIVFNGANNDFAGSGSIHQKCIAVFRQRLGTEPKLAADQAPQVLVIEQSSVDLFSKQDRAGILDRVRQGMGCVVLLGSGRGAGSGPTPKVKELTDGAEKMTEKGHGRIVTVAHPLSHWGQGTYNIEAVYSEVLKAIYSSVNRTSVAIRATPSPLKPDANQPWKVAVDGQGPSTALRASATARVRVIPDLPTPDYGYMMGGHGVAEAREIVAEAAVDLAKGATNATVSLPPLPPGNYMLEAQLLDKEKRVLDWSLAKMAVISPVTIVKIDAGDAAFAGANRPLTAACVITNEGSAAQGLTLLAEVTDPLGRLLARTNSPLTLKSGENAANVSVALPHAELSSAKLSVQVKDKERVLAESSIWCSTEAMMTPVDFSVGPYDDYCDGWRDLGADLTCHYVSLPALGLRPSPWLDIIRIIGADSSMADPAAPDRAKEYIIAMLKNCAPLHTVGCILHDELGWFGFNHTKPTEHDVAFFRQYLNDTYKTIQALNVSWETTYKDWGEITADLPLKIKPETLDKGSPAPWADWYAACEQAAYRFYVALDEAMRQAFPPDGIRMGPSGTGDTSGVNGLDWWLLSKPFRSVCLYEGVHNEMYRSFAASDHLMMRWSHLDGINGVEYARMRPWFDIFVHRVATLTYGGRFTNLFYPDYRPEPGAVAYGQELAAIRNGFGRLVLGAKRDDADTAIFYSPACYRARIIQSRKMEASRAQNAAYGSLSAALADMRIGSRYIAYEQVTRGDLTPQTAKALFLWQALALTEAEAAAIRKYVNAGGIIVANTEPGIYDEHCHKLPQGRLHDLMPAEGTASRVVGKGKFLLFTGLPENYAEMQGYGIRGEGAQAVKNPKGDVTTKFLELLTTEAGLQQRFRLTDRQDKELTQDFDAFGYVDGGARYVACIPGGKYGETVKARLTVNGNGHLYECRTGKYLGTAAVQDVELLRDTGSIFAFLPYKVAKVQLTAPATATLGQPIPVKVVLKTGSGAPVRRNVIDYFRRLYTEKWTESGAPVRHVIVAQLRRPDGKDLPVHRWIFETRDLKIDAHLFSALSDPPGAWTLTITDVASGISQGGKINLIASP